MNPFRFARAKNSSGRTDRAMTRAPTTSLPGPGASLDPTFSIAQKTGRFANVPGVGRPRQVVHHQRQRSNRTVPNERPANAPACGRSASFHDDGAALAKPAPHGINSRPQLVRHPQKSPEESVPRDVAAVHGLSLL